MMRVTPSEVSWRRTRPLHDLLQVVQSAARTAVFDGDRVPAAVLAQLAATLAAASARATVRAPADFASYRGAADKLGDVVDIRPTGCGSSWRRASRSGPSISRAEPSGPCQRPTRCSASRGESA
jgi:hypothetical protein